jgi:CRP-like cAMP-binding protein
VTSACEQCAQSRDCPKTLLEARSGAPALTWQPRRWARGAWLMQQGGRLNGFLIIKYGLVAARHAGPDGVQRVVGLAGRGFLIGQHASQGLDGVVGLQALGLVTACELPFELLDADNAREAPRLLMHFNRRAMAAMLAWSHVARLPRLESRLAAALQLLATQQAPGPLRLPNQAVLAELLGVTRESISRGLRQLEVRGALSRQGQAVSLHEAVLRRLLRSSS